MSLWEPWLEKRVGKFISELSENINDQELFGKILIIFLSH